jgi:hypothetical protein
VKYFDYSCLGVPCICSAHPPYADVIRPGEDGLLCPDDPRAWADAIGQLIRSSQERQRLAQAASHKVETYYTLAHTQEAWRSLLTRLIDDSRERRKKLLPLQHSFEIALVRYERMRGALSSWNRQRLKRRHGRATT